MDGGGVCCWYCGHPVDTTCHRRWRGANVPAYAEIPVSLQAWRDEAGAMHTAYQTCGYFHDLGCARAYLEDRPRPQNWRLFREYADVMWGAAELPPPAPPKLLLRRYGGDLEWDDWKGLEREAEGRWRLTDRAVRGGDEICARLRTQSLVETRPAVVRPTSREVAHPGRGEDLAHLMQTPGWR